LRGAIVQPQFSRGLSARPAQVSTIGKPPRVL
jgi:hypothetical protein